MFSGSAVVDWNNTAGLQTGPEPALIALFTAAGRPFTQGLAASNDRGRTWVKYTNNPVLGHIAGEIAIPKSSGTPRKINGVMPLYLDGNDFAFFSSPDLKSWTKLSQFHLPGDAECPNFFEVSVNGNPQDKRWVFYGANGVYVVGQFDGVTFTPAFPPRHLQQGNAWYASQVFSDIPKSDGRCLMIPWGRMTDSNLPLHQGMPFNQMMGLPRRTQSSPHRGRFVPRGQSRPRAGLLARGSPT